MMGESRLCSYADGNDVAEGKRGDNHKSKSYWAAIGRDEIQRSVGVCFWCSGMGTFLNWKRGRKDFSIGEVLDLAETTWRVAYQMTSIFSIKYEPKPPPDNKNRVGVKNVCGEQRIYKIVFLRSRNSKPAVKPNKVGSHYWASISSLSFQMSQPASPGWVSPAVSCSSHEGSEKAGVSTFHSWGF